MHPRLNQAILGAFLLTILACTGGGDSKAPLIVTGPASMPSSTTPVFDPANANVPLPNILATATAADPLTGRAANRPMTPPEALAYVNLHEVGGTNAVSGLNAPVYIQFNAPVDATTVTAANVKVYQLTPDAAGTENNPLGFADISGLFSYQYTAGGTDLFLFPNFPLLPGTRYLYVVTSRVKDTAGKSISASPFFEALKSLTPLTGSFGPLEPIRANVVSGGNILLSGYAKVMNDLITASATTTVTQRAGIAVLGRFITTGAGANWPGASLQTTVDDTPSVNGATELAAPMQGACRDIASWNRRAAALVRELEVVLPDHLVGDVQGGGAPDHRPGVEDHGEAVGLGELLDELPHVLGHALLRLGQAALQLLLALGGHELDLLEPLLELGLLVALRLLLVRCRGQER